MLSHANYPEQVLYYLDTARPLLRNPIRCALLSSSTPDIFFFNSQVIVDVVRKIQFLLEVYILQCLSLGRKLAEDWVSHSWSWGQFPLELASLWHTALPSLTASLSFSRMDEGRLTWAVYPLPPLSPQLLFGARSVEIQKEDSRWVNLPRPVIHWLDGVVTAHGPFIKLNQLPDSEETWKSL